MIITHNTTIVLHQLNVVHIVWYVHCSMLILQNNSDFQSIRFPAVQENVKPSFESLEDAWSVENLNEQMVNKIRRTM